MRLYDHKTIGSILIVAGTAIGAGMLALPITTASSGFFPAFALFLLCFLYMMSTLFLLLEANLYTRGVDINIVSMAKQQLGFAGQLTAWLTFLLLLYAVASAYISGGGSLIAKLLQVLLPAHHIPTEIGIGLFVIIFGFIVFFGTSCIDYINRILMIGLIVTYIVLVFSAAPHIQWHHFVYTQPKYLWAVVPIVILSFTSHLILPSLRTYLKGDVKKLMRALFIGSLVPLLFYTIWEFMIVGVIPVHGAFGLHQIGTGPHPVAALTTALHSYLKLSWIALVVGCFSVFAMITSFLGVSLSLTDFLADGLQIKKNFWGKIRLLAFTLIPPFLFALYFPTGFVIALSYAGVFVAILYGILPVFMVWKARYHDHAQAAYRLPGGKPMLILIFAGAWVVIFLQLAATLQWLPR